MAAMPRTSAYRPRLYMYRGRADSEKRIKELKYNFAIDDLWVV